VGTITGIGVLAGTIIALAGAAVGFSEQFSLSLVAPLRFADWMGRNKGITI
jgi:hypothetical protein